MPFVLLLSLVYSLQNLDAEPQPKDFVKLTIHDAVDLVRGEVYLEDIATCLEDSVICDEISGVRILESVAPGTKLRITAEQIVSILNAEFPRTTFSVTGAQLVDIRTSEFLISNAEMEKQIATKLDLYNGTWKKLRITLKRFKTFERIVARDSDYQFEISTLDTDVEFLLRSLAESVGGWISMTATIVDQDWRQDFKFNMQVEIESLQPLARHDLEAGKIISSDDLEFGWKRLRRFDQSPQVSQEDLVGKTLSRRVSRSEIVQPRYLKKSQAIVRGNSVKLRLSSGGIILTSEAKAMQAGGIGEDIEVQVVTTKKKLIAKVIDSETVEGKF